MMIYTGFIARQKGDHSLYKVFLLIFCFSFGHIQHCMSDESLSFLLDKPILPNKLADPKSLEFSLKYDDPNSTLSVGHYLALAIYKKDSFAVDLGVMGGLKNSYAVKDDWHLISESYLLGSFIDIKFNSIGLRIEGYYENTEVADKTFLEFKKENQVPIEATFYYEMKTDLWLYGNIGKGIKSNRNDLKGLNYQIGLNFDFDLGHWGPFFAFDFQYYEKARDQIGLSIRMGVSLCHSSNYLRPRIFVEFREGPSFLAETFNRYEKTFQVGLSLSY